MLAALAAAAGTAAGCGEVLQGDEPPAVRLPAESPVGAPFDPAFGDLALDEGATLSVSATDGRGERFERAV